MGPEPSWGPEVKGQPGGSCCVTAPAWFLLSEPAVLVLKVEMMQMCEIKAAAGHSWFIRDGTSACLVLASSRPRVQTRATQSTHVRQAHAGGHQTMQECGDYTTLAAEAEPLEPLEPLEHESEPAAAPIWV